MVNYICSCCGAKYEIEESGTYQCSECGKEFTFTVQEQAPAQPPEPVKNICPYCKSELHPDAVKCAHCGEWVSGPSPQSKTLYIVIAILFGPIAEFITGNYLTGVLFSILYYGAVALWVSAASSGARDAGIGALIAAVAAVLYLINVLTTAFSTKKNIHVQDQKKKKSGIIAPLVIAIILIIAAGIAVAYSLFHSELFDHPEQSVKSVKTENIEKKESPAPLKEPDPPKTFQITHDYQLKFDEPFSPDFEPYEINYAGYKIYSVKTNLKMNNRYFVYTDMHGKILQTVLTISTSSYNIPEALKNSLSQTILKDTTLKPVVSDGVLKIVDIPDLKNPDNKREVSFVTDETNLKITFTIHPLPEIKNPVGKPINGLFGISLGSADPKYPRDEKSFNPSLVYFTPNKKLPFNSDRRGNYYLGLDHAGKIIAINASGKFFQKEWETVIRPTLKKNFEKLYNMTFTETSGGKYGKKGGSYYYASGSRMLLLSWSLPESYEVEFDVHAVDYSLIQNDEKLQKEKEMERMKKLQNSLSPDDSTASDKDRTQNIHRRRRQSKLSK